MSTFVLIHGAGSTSWYWNLVAPRLAARGHTVVAPDLPCDVDGAGLDAYTETVVDAIGDRSDLVVVGQSLGGFTAPLVATRVPTRLLVLVCPMVPRPGETAGEWWAHTGQAEAARRAAEAEGCDPDRPFDPIEMFLHDVDPAVIATSAHHVRRQSERPFRDPWPLPQWPAVPTRCVIGRRDRLFPADFQRRVVMDRLGMVPDEVDSGHLPALSRPDELAGLLRRYREELG